MKMTTERCSCVSYHVDSLGGVLHCLSAFCWFVWQKQTVQLAEFIYWPTAVLTWSAPMTHWHTAAVAVMCYCNRNGHLAVNHSVPLWALPVFCSQVLTTCNMTCRWVLTSLDGCVTVTLITVTQPSLPHLSGPAAGLRPSCAQFSSSSSHFNPF